MAKKILTSLLVGLLGHFSTLSSDIEVNGVQGDNIRFNIITRDEEDYSHFTYKWYKNDVEIPNETGHSMVVSNNEIGMYEIRASVNGKYSRFDSNWDVIISDPSQIVSDSLKIPKETELVKNYPNPFNLTTTIKYNLSHTGNVKLNIYNSNGKFMENIVNKIEKAGNHIVNFDASRFTSGTYFYQLVTDRKKDTKSMILVK